MEALLRILHGRRLEAGGRVLAASPRDGRGPRATSRVAGTWELLDVNGGGDVDLAAMPEDAVHRCRAVWRAITNKPRSVVHGDPGAQNLRLSRTGAGVIDWDEARLEVSALDLAEIPLATEYFRPRARLAEIVTAATAWEAANGWLVEPDYARRKLAALGAIEEF